MKEVTLQMNGRSMNVPAGMTILEAANRMNISIPSLCWLKNMNEDGICRMCVVEIEGEERLVTACTTEVKTGMKIWTHSPRVVESRENTLKLLLSNHEKKCLSCVRNKTCELQELCKEYDVNDDDFYSGEIQRQLIDDTAEHMVRDNNKCIMCRRCVAACEKIQGISAISVNGRGFESYVGSAFDVGLAQTDCVNCGQCVAVCPTGALREKDATGKVFEVIADPKKFVIVQTAPAVRAAIGECFGQSVGSDSEGRMVAALKRLGFNKVFDTNLGADLTIIEEANEFLHRLREGKKLPIITSCCPAWVKYCEYNYPEMLENLSSCKSPHQMFGAIIKTYYAEKLNMDARDIVVISVMPCTAKKAEIGRENENAAGVPDVDYVLTTREIGRMIEKAGIRFMDLPSEEFDAPLGISTGAAAIFGTTGGVMEAALRTAVETLTNEELEEPVFEQVRGMEEVKTAVYKVAGKDIHVAVVSGLANAHKLLDKIKSGKERYDFIEIMACPGGCINGGGQPYQTNHMWNFENVREKRASVLYNIDEARQIRKSHKNPVVQELYHTYLQAPGSEQAHAILHTTYSRRIY